MILRHQKFTFPRLSGASERANGRASGSVLHSGFLIILAHSDMQRKRLGETDTNFEVIKEGKQVGRRWKTVNLVLERKKELSKEKKEREKKENKR